MVGGGPVGAAVLAQGAEVEDDGSHAQQGGDEQGEEHQDVPALRRRARPHDDVASNRATDDDVKVKFDE